MARALPALLGGAPVRPEGPPGWPPPDEAILQALQAAFRAGSWAKYNGPHVAELVRRLAQHHEVDFVLPCGSGTFAVELALRALKVEPGDEVVLSAYDYPGNFLGVHAVGATPVLVDVSPDNWNLEPTRLEEAIGPRTRAVIASHLHGGIVPMAELTALALTHGLAVIEDAAQAPGASVQGRKAGAWGDAAVVSFGGSKLLSSGRGGALLTKRADVYQRARTWQNRGNIVNPLSELQAAVLLPQLARLDERNAQRSASVQQLGKQLADIPGLCLFSNRVRDSQPGYYKLGFQFAAGAFGLPRETFVAAVGAEGIALDAGFRALHVGRSPNRFRQVGELAEARRAHEGCVILHHPVLLGSAEDVAEVSQAIRKVHESRAGFSA